MASITGTNGADTITPAFLSPGVTGGAPGDGADSISGGIGNDSIEGAGGNDTIDSGNGSRDGTPGANTMAGGAGDDLYLVYSPDDLVIEGSGGGIDEIIAGVGYAIRDGQEIERLTLAGTATFGIGNAGAERITGNIVDNLLIGNDGNDTLAGGAPGQLVTGSDTLIGGDGNDSLIGGAGDLLIGGSGDDRYFFLGGEAPPTIIEQDGIDTIETYGDCALPSGVENLELFAPSFDVVGFGNALANRILGSAGANWLQGRDGNDTLLGGTGADTLDGGTGNDSLDGTGAGEADRLIGGTGNDAFSVDATADIVIELSGEGSDTVTATASCTLPGFVEDLILAGTAPLAGTGNADANHVTGNAAANLLDGSGGDDTLSGGRGNDTLIGGAGADLLIGGKGRDVFRYLAPIGPPDTIKGYNDRQDGIEVSAAGFGAGLVAGMTIAAQGRFTANATGTPEDFLPQFILNTTTGLLRWDADGINDISAVDIAFLPGATGLTGAEILVIA